MFQRFRQAELVSHLRHEVSRIVLSWTGDRTCCTVTLTDGGMTQVARTSPAPTA